MRDRTKIILTLAFVLVATVYVYAQGRRDYQFGPKVTSTDDIGDDTIDTDAIIDQAVTLAKMVDGAAIGDMLWWDGSDWLFFDANEPDNILRLTDANQPEWSSEAITTVNNIKNDIIYNVKLKKSKSFADGDIITVDTAGQGFTGDTLAVISAAQPLAALPGGIEQPYIFNILSPSSVYDTDTQVLIDISTSASITFTEVLVSLDADPTTELQAELKFADAFIGLANSATICTIDTTNGAATVTSFTDATVGSGKCIYLEFNAQPDAATTNLGVKAKWDYD